MTAVSASPKSGADALAKIMGHTVASTEARVSLLASLGFVTELTLHWDVEAGRQIRSAPLVVKVGQTLQILQQKQATGFVHQSDLSKLTHGSAHRLAIGT